MCVNHREEIICVRLVQTIGCRFLRGLCRLRLDEQYNEAAVLPFIKKIKISSITDLQISACLCFLGKSCSFPFFCSLPGIFQKHADG